MADANTWIAYANVVNGGGTAEAAGATTAAASTNSVAKEKNEASSTASQSKTTTTTPKLKDACDMCAASKVRCDRRKPVCGRCAKLEYPCFFSPARRNGGRDRQRQRVREREPGPTGSFNTSSFISTAPRLASNSTSSSSSNSHSSTTTTSVFTSTATPSSSLGSLSEHTSHLRTASISSSLAAELGRLPTNTTTTEPSDCITIASNTLLQLTLARHKLKLTLQQQREHPHARSQPHPQVSAAPELTPRAAALETVTAALRTLSSVLVCPCSDSEEPAFPLLAAAVCLAMLEVYGAIISDARATTDKQQQEQAPTTDDSNLSMDTEHAMMLFDLHPCALAYEASVSSTWGAPVPKDEEEDEDATVVRVLGELTKMGRLVVQFSKRYEEGDGDVLKHSPRSPSYLIALATLLRSHLRSVTMKVVV